MTDAPRSLFGRLRASVLVRVLLVYGGASWVVVEIVSTFREEFGLPTWFFPAAIGLLLIGLPIILATGMVQDALRQRPAAVPLPEFAIEGEPGPDAESAQAPARAPVHPLHRWLTWQKSILTGVLAFTALGIVGTIIVVRGSARVTEAYGAAGDAFGEREWIVVAEFEGPPDEPELAAAVRHALTLDLQQSRYVNVYTPAQMGGVLRLMELPDTVKVDGELGREIAQREGLAAVLVGSISRLEDSYVLGASVLQPASGEELIVVGTTAARGRAIDAVQALSREIRSRLGESREAIRASQPLPRVTTRSLEALQRQAQAVEAMSRSDYERAIELAEAAIDLDPEFAMAYRLAGAAHGNLGRLSEDERYTTRAYELREKLSERERLHIEARYASRVLGDPLQAAAKYELILSSYPDDGRAAINLAAMAGLMGEYERAYRSALRAVELRPYIAVAYGNAIANARRLDLWAAAESLAHLAMSRGLTERATRWLWSQAVAEGEWARAEAVCDSLLAATPPRGPYRSFDESTCGQLHIAQGRIGRAVERLRRGAALRSERGQYLAFYVNTAYQVQAELLRDRRAEARDWLDQALRRHPLDSIAGFDRVAATWWAGSAAAQLGDLGRADGYAEAMAADTSDYSEAAWTLRLYAVIALANGDYEEALDYDRRGADRDFGRTLVYDQLYRAQAFDALEQRDSAVAHYEEVVAPHSFGATSLYLAYLPLVHRRLGELYAELGEPAKAAEHYQTFIELWSDCDPELRPQVEAARQALERLGAERAAAGQTSGGGG